MSKRTVELELATPGLDARGQPVRVPLGVAAAPGASDVAPPEPDLPGEHMLINLGPQHPATHGVLRLVVELDGETVVRVIPHLGYLHSGFEKLGEYRHYNQIIPLTDRTDYLSPMANNVGFALAAEKLMGIEITPRCTVLRVIACEMSRIISHMVWLGTTSIDLGAFTPFLWAFQERERIYDLQEMWTGARLTTSLTRVGGLMADIPDRILEQAVDRLPDGPINVDDPRVILPSKTRAMSDMEAMIFHFKQVMEGVKAPVGEAYVGIENPKGELGTYLVSDGTAKPVRWRIRPPSFINLAALPKMAEGHLLSDLIAINASVDIVMGEVDR